MQTNEYNTIIELLNKALERIETQEKNPALSQSADTSALDVALAKAQGEFVVVGFNADNPYFKSSYSKLDAILSMALPILSKHGIAFVQREHKVPNGPIWLITQIRHAGQWMESRVVVRHEKDGIQEYGKVLTYNKRYSAMALLGITCANDPDDDDGESDMERIRLKELEHDTRRMAPEKTVYSGDKLTAEQVQSIDKVLYNRPDVATELYRSYSDALKIKITSTEQLPKSEYYKICEKIKENIRNNPYPK